MTYGFFVNDQCNLKSNQYNCNMNFANGLENLYMTIMEKL